MPRASPLLLLPSLQEDLALIITNTKRRRRPSPAPQERNRAGQYGNE
jgi:hypothetical protein